MTVPASIAAFFGTVVGGVFALCYLAHRFDRQTDWLMDQWWGVPVALFGSTAAIIGFAAGAASIAGAVL